MVDFHSHVLPGIDDGSRSAEESLDMLKLSCGQGVDIMAATPHFYADRDDPKVFLLERRHAAENLYSAIKASRADNFPKLLLGAEVAYFDGMYRSQILKEMTLEGTELLLVEMPFCRWTEPMLKELIGIRDYLGLTPMIAHIDRYFEFIPGGALEQLAAEGIQVQANAESFASWRLRRRLVNMISGGLVHVLGSDCHSMNRRKPNMEIGREWLAKKMGTENAERFFDRSYELLGMEKNI